MSKPRVIQATFQDWRPVKGRKQLQLVFEVPLEQQTEVLTMLGPPGIAEDKWVAIALLNDNRAAQGGTSAVVPEAEAPRETAKPKRKLEELPPSQQAGILCSDESFRQYVAAIESDNSVIPENWVREMCVVESRSELDKDECAAHVWHRIIEQYRRWQTDQRYSESIRK